MPGIPLQQSIVYGPVFSRRLGRSLGINLLPKDRKVCSFNCVYCEYGDTGECTLQPSADGLPSVEDVLHGVEKALQKPRTIETITFSGNGEPTLHPDFLEIVLGVIGIREKYRPEAKLAVLSNSSTSKESHILAALERIDMPIMKLDAGEIITFQKVNQPAEDIIFEDIQKGLKTLKGLIIQSALIDGINSNTHGEAYETWASKLAELNPCQVQIYSTDRPTSQIDVLRVSPVRLGKIENDLRTRFHLEATAYWRE